MSKHRGFSVVLHDVQDGTQTKQDVIDFVFAQSICQGVVAQEPSPEEGKFHIHVFYRLENPRHFKTHLKLWVLWWKAGRVQVDAMKGTMAQACRYLMEDFTLKDKHTDPNPWFYPTREIAKSPAEHADEWFDWFLTSSGPTRVFPVCGLAYGESFRASARLQAI